MTSYSIMNGVRIVLVNEKGCYLTQSRNKLVSGALKHDPEYLFWVDSDMVFPADALVRLLQHKKDIVGATYARRAPPYDMLGHLPKGTDLVAGGLVEADVLPTGMLLVRADVFRKLKWPWFYETYHRERADGRSITEAFFDHLDDSFQEKVPGQMKNILLESPVFRKWLIKAHDLGDTDKSYPYIGDDYNFMLKARKAGYKIWCDLELTYNIGHIGDQVIAVSRPDGKTASESDVREVLQAVA
jgi:hypothetical protein